MHGYFPGVLALYWLVSIVSAWSLGTVHAEACKNQALHRQTVKVAEKGERDRASAAVNSCLAQVTELHSAQSEKEAAAQRHLGEVYLRAGHYEKAIEAFRQALAIFSVDPGPSSEEVGTLYAAIADAQQAEGQRGEAITSFRQALKILEVNPGPEAAATATCLNKLSLLLLYRGALAEAESLMQRALRIRQKLYPGQAHPDVAASLGNLGLLYFQMGAYEEAKEPLNRALDILDELAGKDAAYLLGASNVRRTLAALHAAQGQFGEAETLLQRVVADTSKQFGKDSCEAAKAMAALAGVQLDEKRFKEAEGSFTEASRILSRHLPASYEDLLRTQNSLAICFQYQGNYAKARQMLEGIMEACGDELGKDHPLTIAVTHNFGMTLVTLGETTRAREHTRAFLNFLGDNFEAVLAHFPENRRLSYARNMGFSPYDLAATLGDGPLTADAVLTFKGAVLESVARDRRRALLARGSENAKLIEQIDELRQQFLEAQLAGDTHRSKSLSVILEEKEKELSSSLGEDGTYRPLQQVSWTDVAQRLPVGATLLEFFFYKKHLGGNGGWEDWCGAVALTRECDPVFRELGPSGAILKSIRNYLDVAKGDSFEMADEASETAVSLGAAFDTGAMIRMLHNAVTETACRDLFDRLMLPFAEAMPRDGAQLFICPDGRLNFVSFATLLDHHNHFLGSSFQVTYVDSGRVFLERSAPQEAPSHTITLLGGPNFDRPESDTNAPAIARAATQSVNEGELHEEVTRGFAGLPACFRSLPGSIEEVEAIGALFCQKGWQTRLLRDSAATEAELRAAAPGSGIIHLATHGCFMGEFNTKPQARISDPMFRGWLALAGANATLRTWKKGEVPPPANDGILMAAEVTGLDLSAAELVTFSACETARGEPCNGEGILGLRRGVALAGAKNLLLTCWEVQDRYTVNFMKQLYASMLGGSSPAEALHKIQAGELTRLQKQHETFLAVHLAGPFLITSLKN
jgi:CHAT domain-containing protein/tetratricopeptide (TPR) repeat protein